MKRLVVKSQAGSLYYNDAERGLRLEPHEITPHQRRLLLGRLHVYEDTGLTPDQIRELKERDTAKPPIDIEDNYGFFVCPSCGNSIYACDDFESHKFCLNCGQRLKWEE